MNTERHSYQTFRYRPGVWNGLNGGTDYAQYFNRESESRVSAMLEVAALLRENRIGFTVERWVRYNRLTISDSALKTMPETLKKRIIEINASNSDNW